MGQTVIELRVGRALVSLDTAAPDPAAQLERHLGKIGIKDLREFLSRADVCGKLCGREREQYRQLNAELDEHLAALRNGIVEAVKKDSPRAYARLHAHIARFLGSLEQTTLDNLVDSLVENDKEAARLKIALSNPVARSSALSELARLFEAGLQDPDMLLKIGDLLAADPRLAGGLLARHSAACTGRIRKVMAGLRATASSAIWRDTTAHAPVSSVPYLPASVSYPGAGQMSEPITDLLEQAAQDDFDPVLKKKRQEREILEMVSEARRDEVQKKTEVEAKLSEQDRLKYREGINRLKAQFPNFAVQITSMADRSLELFEPGTNQDPQHLVEQIESYIREKEREAANNAASAAAKKLI